MRHLLVRLTLLAFQTLPPHLLNQLDQLDQLNHLNHHYLPVP
jgi:hypothetical protein